jgi:hypothetical protein
VSKKKATSPLPSATIYGANINEFVAWDGQRYVLRQTRDSVLADDSLRLIGSVRELSRWMGRGPAYVFVPDPWEHACSPRDASGLEPPSGERFRPLDEGYQVIEFHGHQYDLTPIQATVIKVLHIAHQNKRSSVGIAEIHKAMQVSSGKMSQWFRGKNKALYGKLIVQATSRLPGPALP